MFSVLFLMSKLMKVLQLANIILTICQLDQVLVQIQQQLHKHTQPSMSQLHTSPNPKCEIKPSLKKSNKADQSKSKKKQIESNEKPKNASSIKKDNTIEDKVMPILQSKSSKKAALQLKGQLQFKEQAIEAEKSEKSAKVMKSSDRNTTIKENHNNVESNVRQFSHSKENDDQLELSKKKINTQSKKSKIIQSGSKHSKTEEKILTANEIKQQKCLTGIIKEKQPTQQGEKINNIADVSQLKKDDQENQPKNINEDKKIPELSQNDTKGSKNLKRSQIFKSVKDVDQNIHNMKKSKSAKQSQPKSQAKSKDSKVLQLQKSGMKKTKPNQRWH